VGLLTLLRRHEVSADAPSEKGARRCFEARGRRSAGAASTPCSGSKATCGGGTRSQLRQRNSLLPSQVMNGRPKSPLPFETALTAIVYLPSSRPTPRPEPWDQDQPDSEPARQSMRTPDQHALLCVLVLSFGALSRAECPPGAYLEAGSCLACEAGNYCLGGNDTQTPCPPNSDSSADAYRQSFCICDQGFTTCADDPPLWVSQSACDSDRGRDRACAAESHPFCCMSFSSCVRVCCHACR